MDRLAHVDELLDGPLDDRATLVGNLRDLARVNRWLGGTRLSLAAIERLAPDAADLRILDVGTGGADVPVALLADARRRGRSWRVVALDSRPEILSAARIARPGLDAVPGLALEIGDGRRLAAADGSFDIVHCSLVLHHLDPPEALLLLREMGRVARLGIVVNDLARSAVHWRLARLLVAIGTRNAFTRHDGPLSVRRAYTRSEARVLIAEAGLEPVAEVGGLLGHRFAIAAVPNGRR